MAITVDATSSGQSASSPLAFSQTCSVDANLLIVGIAYNTANTISGVTFNGVSMTLVRTYENVTSGRKVSFYKLANPDSGAHNVSISWSGGSSMLAAAISFENAGEVDAYGENGGGSGSSQSVTVNTNGTGDGFVVSGLSIDGTPASTITESAGTEFGNQGDGNGDSSFVYQSYASGGNITQSWTTDNSVAWAALGIEIKDGFIEYTQTIQAKARIKVAGNTKTVTAKSRIEVIGNTKTVTAKARVKISGNDKTISARAKIGMVQTQTIQAKTDIFNSVDKTVDAKARISQDGNTDTIDAKARILKIQSQEIQAKARMEVTQGKTIQAKARIEILSTSVTVTAKARVKQAGVTNTITAMARILKVQTQTIQAKARMWAARLNVKIGRRADGAQSGVRFVRHG